MHIVLAKCGVKVFLESFQKIPAKNHFIFFCKFEKTKMVFASVRSPLEISVAVARTSQSPFPLAVISKKMHKQILDLIKRYSENNSNQRFGQILFNLAINQFDNSCNEENKLRDIYNDSDEEILERVKKQLQLFELQKKTNINKNS